MRAKMKRNIIEDEGKMGVVAFILHELRMYIQVISVPMLHWYIRRIIPEREIHQIVLDEKKTLQ